MRNAAALVAAIAIVRPSCAQTVPVPLPAGQRIALRIPPAAFAYKADGGPNGPTLIAAATRAPGGVRLNGSDDWASRGFASTNSAEIVSAKADRQTGLLNLTVLASWGGAVIITVALKDTAFVLPKLFAPASDTLRAEKEIEDAVGRRVFAATASTISAGQRRLLNAMHGLVHNGAVEVISFAGRPYTFFHANESTYSCSDTHDAPRLSGVIGETVLRIVRTLGSADSTMNGSFGFAIAVKMKSAITAAGYSCANPPAPEITVYIPADVSAQFAAGQITSQEMIDLATVMVAGLKAKVDLAK